MKDYITYALGGIAAALLVVLILLNITDLGNMSPKKAGEFAVDYIGTNLRPDLEFSFKDAKKISGVYEVVIEVDGTEDKVYVTTDGKYLFFQPIDMKPEEKTAKIPDVDLFVMSYCPYGNTAEEFLMPIVDLLGDKAEIELHYILYSNYGAGYPDDCIDEEEKYCSLHGIQELNQGLRELCVQKYQPEKFWDFVKAANDGADYTTIDSLWEGIATSVGVDIDQVKTCFNDEAEDILAEELALSTEYDVSGSPTLVINGITFNGSRSVEGYQEGICNGFKNVPEECDVQLTTDQDPAPAGSCN